MGSGALPAGVFINARALQEESVGLGMAYKIDNSVEKRPWAAAGGGLKLVFAMILYWVGITSFLTGAAYSVEKGSWAAVTSGIIMGLCGVALISRGVHQILRNLAPNLYDEEEL